MKNRYEKDSKNTKNVKNTKDELLVPETTNVSTAMTTNLHANNAQLIQMAVSSLEEKLYARIEEIAGLRKDISVKIDTNSKLLNESFNALAEKISNKKEILTFVKTVETLYGHKVNKNYNQSVSSTDDTIIKVVVSFSIRSTSSFPKFITEFKVSSKDLKIRNKNIELREEYLKLGETAIECKKRINNIDRLERKANAALAKEVLKSSGHGDLAKGIEDSMLNLDSSLNKLLN